jgi:hypothetical protein
MKFQKRVIDRGDYKVVFNWNRMKFVCKKCNACSVRLLKMTEHVDKCKKFNFSDKINKFGGIYIYNNKI